MDTSDNRNNIRDDDKNNRNNRDRKSGKEPFAEKLELLGEWLVQHAKIVMPVVLALCVIITVVISVNANKRESAAKEEVTASSPIEEETSGEESGEILEVPLKENDNPQIAQLMTEYYAAQVSGDAQKVRELVDDIDDTVVMRIEETSKYIEDYPTLDIYYKEGPRENTYVVYVCSEVKFIDYDEPVPGMTVHYVCQRENGDYYINRSEEGDEYELNYIREVNLQDDVIDLSNKVTAAYNNMVAENPELKQLILDVNEEIEKNIGEALAQATEEEKDDAGDGDGQEDTEGGSEDAQTQEATHIVTKVKATDVVNIRSSDSETADKLGKAALGEEFELIEKIENGWSKVRYDGGEAYIKSEYLEDVETIEAEALEGDDSGNSQETSEITTNGTVTVIENVRIRSGASENSEKLATAYVGEKLELIMKQADGWTKIKYNGQTAYVKSEFVE